MRLLMQNGSSAHQATGRMTPPRDRWSRKSILVLLVLAALIQIGQWGIWRPLRWPGVDYGKHWDAARAVLENRNNYFIDGSRNDELWLGFNYPQATAFMFLWLGFVSRAHGEVVWKMFNLA